MRQEKKGTKILADDEAEKRLTKYNELNNSHAKRFNFFIITLSLPLSRRLSMIAQKDAFDNLVIINFPPVQLLIPKESFF